MKLLRLIFGMRSPHHERERKVTADLEEARARNDEATERNRCAVDELVRTVREGDLIEALTDGVLREVRRK